jgi:hypothetical protein
VKGVQAEGNLNLILQYDVGKTLQILKERIQSYMGGVNYLLQQNVQQF